MNNEQSTIAAIVLAGGQSSRMGRDKALISIEGVPLIQHVCEVAGDCASTVYVVTPWPERYQDTLPNNCFLVREVQSIGETKPHCPLLGFAQGLSSILSEEEKNSAINSKSDRWVLLLACDLPKLQSSVLQNWADRLDTVEEDAIAFLPRNANKGWEPLCGFYRLSCLSLLTEFTDRGGKAFQPWLAQHIVRELPLTEQDMLFNCNTPNDLAAIDRVIS